jgi:hypothetical protein
VYVGMVYVTTNAIVNKLLIRRLDVVRGHSIAKISFKYLTVHWVTSYNPQQRSPMK